MNVAARNAIGAFTFNKKHFGRGFNILSDFLKSMHDFQTKIKCQILLKIDEPIDFCRTKVQLKAWKKSGCGRHQFYGCQDEKRGLTWKTIKREID